MTPKKTGGKNTGRARPKAPAPGPRGDQATTKKRAAGAAPQGAIPPEHHAAPLPPPASVTIAQAKGRPMLVWVGKRPLSRVTAFPAQAVERFDAGDGPQVTRTHWQDWPAAYPQGGLLFHGDNKEVLAHLLANGFRGKVNLIYIDPPFDSGADYVRKVSLRGATGSARIDGEQYTLGEQIQYTDIWANDTYLQFMYERLLLLKELLAAGGCIWLHCDWHKSHHLRALLDEVMGADAIRNEVVWQRTASRNDAHAFGHVHDTLYYYTKSGDRYCWNALFIEHTREFLDRYYGLSEPDGRRFAADNLTQAGLRAGSSGSTWRKFAPAAKGLHWKFATARLDELDKEGRIYWPSGGTGFPRLKRYLDELRGKAISTLWDDVFSVNSQAEERGDYPTQKPESLLQRIVSACSNPGDLVLDCFIGSGTSAAVAQKLGRRWIGCDINKGAIQTTAKRLQEIMREQVEQARLSAEAGRQGSLLETGATAEETAIPPAQLSFSVWRVNDYDLQIQHNEAVNLACEHVGVQRTRTDRFFDGALGRRLVKITPFNHPLSPVDLEELKRELDSRPDEDRGVVIVCLGIEIAARAWIEDWNRLRKGRNAANRVEIIELRTDPKYGPVIRHEPARTRVSVQRRGEMLRVVIEDFVSPTIVERLRQQAGVLQPSIEDWRSMVDCVMIDPAFDGRVFNVALADIPERRDDLVGGSYDVPWPAGPTTVAVKVVDMLGEEVVTLHRV